MGNRCVVMIPCYNEEVTIVKVIHDVNRYLPAAEIVVFDNNSTDSTAQLAEQNGARVLNEKRLGKGYVVQSMFSKIDADVYVMVDGDDTYDLSLLPEMVKTVADGQADMVVGSRLNSCSERSFRKFHAFGNRLVAWLVNKLFGGDVVDIMSGLRVMNREFVKSNNISSSGFEVETEITIKAIKYRWVLKEVNIDYRERPAGSFSKLNTYRDGLLVLKTIFLIFRDYKPFLFFSFISFMFFFVSLLSGSIVIAEFIETRYIRHVPLAIFASGSMILSFILFITGVILDCSNKRFDEIYHLTRRIWTKS